MSVLRCTNCPLLCHYVNFWSCTLHKNLKVKFPHVPDLPLAIKFQCLLKGMPTTHTCTKTTHDISLEMQLHKSCAHRGWRNEWAGQKTGGESPVREGSVLKCRLSLMDVGSVERRFGWQQAFREHLVRPGAAGREQTHWSRQHTGVYGDLWLAKSGASFKISS